MENSLEKLFKDQSPAMPAGLSDRAYMKVALAAEKYAASVRRGWSIFGAVALAGSAFTGYQAIASFGSSNFGSYISLIFSDGATAAAVWKVALMSLLESLPIAGIGLFLASLAVLLYTARKIAVSSDRILVPVTI